MNIILALIRCALIGIYKLIKIIIKFVLGVIILIGIFFIFAKVGIAALILTPIFFAFMIIYIGFLIMNIKK